MFSAIVHIWGHEGHLSQRRVDVSDLKANKHIWVEKVLIWVVWSWKVEVKKLDMSWRGLHLSDLRSFLNLKHIWCHLRFLNLNVHPPITQGTLVHIWVIWERYDLSGLRVYGHNEVEEDLVEVIWECKTHLNWRGLNWSGKTHWNCKGLHLSDLSVH